MYIGISCTSWQIYKKDLCFLDYPSCPVLVKMCKDRQYPPRFILEVDAHEATKSICTKVAFPGVKEYFKRATPSSDIKLKFHPQGIIHGVLYTVTIMSLEVAI